MHQEHNVPWNTVASHFRFIRDNPQRTPRKTGLFALNQPRQAQDLNHFVRALAQTITTFGRTERAKYPASYLSPSTGKLFTDELRDRYPEYLNGTNQLIEHWISRARRDYSPEGNPTYDTSHGDLADVVKILINENQLSTLLMLAHHPQIPLHRLRNLSWGHHFGFSRVAEAALQAYVFFNLAAATNTLNGGEYAETSGYESMVRDLTQSMDYPAQQLPHRAFFRSSGRDASSSVPDAVHEDLHRLKEYLKELFRLLYRYDVVVRECGGDPEWESEINGTLSYPFLGPLKIEYSTTSDGRYTRRFV